MGRTQIPGDQVGDGTIQRVDLDTTTAGEAVIAKAIAGTGISLSSTGVDAGTGDVTLNLSTPVSIANGGTGQATANAALNALLPSQGGNSGKFLKTDASNASWAAI